MKTNFIVLFNPIFKNNNVKFKHLFLTQNIQKIRKKIVSENLYKKKFKCIRTFHINNNKKKTHQVSFISIFFFFSGKSLKQGSAEGAQRTKRHVPNLNGFLGISCYRFAA